MSIPYNLRLLDERHVSIPIDHLLWSPKMDLLLLSNINGEVALYRLSWQKVWQLKPPQEGLQVCSLAWQPDGRVAAIGYSSGLIFLVGIEMASVLHQHDIGNSVVSLQWIESTKQNHVVLDDWNFLSYLPPLIPLSVKSGNVQISDSFLCDTPAIDTIKSLNILVAGTPQGVANIFALGVFPCGIVNFNSCDLLLQEVFFCQTFDKLFAVMNDRITNEINIKFADTSVLSVWSTQLFLLSQQYVVLLQLLTYIKESIFSIQDAWEDVLMEMDVKLEAYSKSYPGGSASADFLDLLLSGTASDELTSFLLQQLNLKALKKSGHALELSYTNIQKLLLHHLQPAGHHLLLRLQYLFGLGSMYPIFDLNATNVRDVQNTAGAFLCKTLELQQLIDASVRNLQTFYRWIHSVILRLTEEGESSGEPVRLSQQELESLANFLDQHLSKYENDNSSHVPCCSLDKVGQYLQDSDLPFPPRSDSCWSTFIKNCSQLKDVNFIYFDEPQKSLVQLFKKLQNNLFETLNKPTLSIQLLFHSPVSLLPQDFFYKGIVKTVAYSDSFCVILFTKKENLNDDLLFFDLSSTKNIKGLRFSFDYSEFCSPIIDMQAIDIAFYSSEQLFVLLGNCAACVLYQLPLSLLKPRIRSLSATKEFPSLSDLCNLPDANFKKLDTWSPHSFDVSGLRKVIAILFKTCKRIHLYETEVEEDISKDCSSFED